MSDLAAPLNALLITFVGLILTALVAVLTWIGKQALLKLDRLVETLAEINRRIDRVEDRITTQEKRI